jgi:hypothetical protein
MEIFISIIGGIFTILGLFFYIFTMRDYIRFRKEKSSPTVLGTIQQSRIIEYHHRGWELSEGWPETSYFAEVVYTFIVDGVLYKSTDIDFGVHSGNISYSKGQAQEIVDRYPKDTQVTVYYKSGNPKYSALEIGGMKTRSIIGIVFGLISIIVGILVILYAWKWS